MKLILENWRKFILKEETFTPEDLKNIRIFSEEIEALSENLLEEQLLDEGIVGKLIGKLSGGAKAGWDKIRGVTFKKLVDAMEDKLAANPDPETKAQKVLALAQDNLYSHDISNMITVFRAWKAGEKVDPEKLKRFVTFLAWATLAFTAPVGVVATKIGLGKILGPKVLMATNKVIGQIISTTTWALFGKSLGNASRSCIQKIELTSKEQPFDPKSKQAVKDMARVLPCILKHFGEKVIKAVKRTKEDEEAVQPQPQDKKSQLPVPVEFGEPVKI